MCWLSLKKEGALIRKRGLDQMYVHMRYAARGNMHAAHAQCTMIPPGPPPAGPRIQFGKGSPKQPVTRATSHRYTLASASQIANLTATDRGLYCTTQCQPRYAVISQLLFQVYHSILLSLLSIGWQNDTWRIFWK